MAKQNKALTVYKASAGSGKTFTLAAEFIKLIINDPRDFNKILAVTFTNKATEEMKHRIVSQLYGLANNLSDSNDYMEKISNELGITPEVISQKASEALFLLLHNYNQFRVQTIDAFFQSILRNMAKELGLGNNMRIGLNDKQIISEAVDNLFDTLDKDKELMTWIMNYIQEKMEAKNSWDITNDVKRFGINISKEFFKSHEHLLQTIDSQPEFYVTYKATLKKEEQIIKKKYEKYADTFFEALEKAGLTINDLSNKSRGVAGYFIKLKRGEISNDIFNATAEKALNDENKWGVKANNATIAPLAKSIFMPLMMAIEKDRSKDAVTMNSIKLTLSNLNKMRLLSSIRMEVDRLNRENSRFLLSNTQVMLNQMINNGNSEAPFIFEKIGAYISHIMIDEFQDTSTTQWKNFQVLLDECISASGNNTKGMINNLIVGDVKQSIYRFRSGDWRLLNGISSDYPGTVNIENLETNWRSERNIIKFNNAFFKRAAEIVADSIMPEKESEKQEAIKKNDLSKEIIPILDTYAQELRNAYKDVGQEVPKKKEEKPRGLVKMEFLPCEDSTAFVEESAEKTLNYVKSLIQQGAGQSDICIIVRENKEATTIANYFAKHEPNLKIVSEQAFTLEASPLVQMLVNAMKFLSNNKDIEAKVVLLKLYTRYIKHMDTDDGTLLTDDNAFNLYMPEEICSEASMESMLSMSLYELTEHLFRIFSLNEFKGQETYACAFFDGLKKYLDDNGAIIEDFLAYWDEELCHKAIAVDGVDSIRIITIHKSKGLQFKHVVMPFCNWRIGPMPNRPPTIWCEIEQDTHKEIGKLPFIPIDYTSKKCTKDSIFEKFGTDEWMQDLVDNLNLLYVAFTRAERSLYVISDQSNSEASRTSLLLSTIETMDKCELENIKIEGLDDGNKEDAAKAEKALVTLTYGTHYIKDDDTKADKGNKEDAINIFEVKPEPLNVDVNSFDSESIVFRQSNKSREFANDAKDETDANRFTTMGNIMHMLFSKIRTIDDIEKTLRQFEFDGIIYDEDVTPEMLRNELMQKFNNPTVSHWFSKHWTVFNECNIVKIENNVIKQERPDRVITDGKETIVIDYKFGQRNESYKKQVQRYMELMKKMNYANVKGYIWYVSEDDGIVPVNL